MQRTEDGGVVISCDFCGTDWDGVQPMVEGHRGSVLCLNCLKAALVEMAPAPGKGDDDAFTCTLCLRAKLPVDLPHWKGQVRPEAVVCRDCIKQAARAFDRDPDVAWKEGESVSDDG